MSNRHWVGGGSGTTTSWSNAANWAEGSVPVNGDDVFIGRGADVSTIYNIDAGLDQSAVTLNSLHIYDAYTGTLGTRTAALQVGATSVFIHEPSNADSATGSGRINLDLGSSQTTILVFGSASSTSDVGLPPIRIVATNAHNDAYVSGNAKVGFAVGDATEAATLTSLNAALDASGRGPAITLGPNCTLGTIEQAGGTITNQGSNATTVLVTNGTYTAYGSATHATVNARGSGKVIYSSDGTLTAAVIEGQATLDLSRDPRAKTITTLTARDQATVSLDNGNPGSITITNGIDVYGSVALGLWKGGINVALAAA